MNSRAQTELLLNAFRSPGLLLILDGFERVVRAYGSLGAAYQGDRLEEDDSGRDCINPYADAFMRGVGAFGYMLQSKILMTTRLTPRAVEVRGQFLQGCRETELLAMSKDDAVAFLQAQGIRGGQAEIEAACDPYGYHPLSLRILAGLIAREGKKGEGDQEIGDKECARMHAQKALELATCDGGEYTYKVAWDEAQAMLKDLG